MQTIANYAARARALVAAGATFAACGDTGTDTDDARGIAPLLARYDAKKTLAGCAVCDRVVGAGAAYLYVLLAPATLHAPVLSRPALEILTTYGVRVTYDTLVSHIVNRTGDGVCPMERAVAEATTPTAALAALRETLKRLQTKEKGDALS